MSDPQTLNAAALPPWLVPKAIGIAVSLVTTGLSFVAGRLWKGVLKPYAQDFVWSGMKLAPTYQGTSEVDGKIIHDHIELKQRAGRVWGTMYTPAGKTGKYKFKAELMNGILRGTFEGFDRTSAARGSFVLALDTGDVNLVGYCIEPLAGSIVAYKYLWNRRQ